MSENENLERLRRRWQEILDGRKDLFALYPDPVQSLIELLGDLPGDEATLRETIEEPYG